MSIFQKSQKDKTNTAPWNLKFLTKLPNMDRNQSKSGNTDPVATLYKAARDGSDVVVKDVLQRMSITERSNAL